MEVKITTLDAFGRGITRVNNKICFVDRALPTEVCDIKIVKENKKYSEAEVINMLEESKYRIMPLCPYYEKCGGCHIMHYDRQSELIYKEEKVSDLINKIGKLNNIRIKDIAYGNEFFYRNKLTLHVDNNKIGLYQEKSHDIIEIDECLITNKTINEIVSKLKEYLKKNKNDLEEIIIRITSLNETMLVLKGDIDTNNFIKEFSNITSIYLNDNLIHGNKYILETINDLSFEIYPKSFFQVNYEMMKYMYNKVIEFKKENKDLNVLDLYCGTGTIGMLISKYCKSVIGVEVNSEAITSANRCKDKNGINNISFYLGKVEDKIDMFSNIDSIVVDPPRSGLDKHTISTILKLNPKSIIYISCDPATLARDLNLLKDNNIHLLSVQMPKIYSLAQYQISIHPQLHCLYYLFCPCQKKYCPLHIQYMQSNRSVCSTLIFHFYGDILHNPKFLY